MVEERIERRMIKIKDTENRHAILRVCAGKFTQERDRKEKWIKCYHGSKQGALACGLSF